MTIRIEVGFLSENTNKNRGVGLLFLESSLILPVQAVPRLGQMAGARTSPETFTIFNVNELWGDSSTLEVIRNRSRFEYLTLVSLTGIVLPSQARVVGICPLGSNSCSNGANFSKLRCFLKSLPLLRWHERR